MNFANLGDMAYVIRRNLHRLPEAARIVGVPASGMLPATLLASLRGVPVCSLALLCSGVNGEQYTTRKKPHNQQQPIIVIDDSIASGRTMKKVMEDCKRLPYTVVFVAVYGEKPQYEGVTVLEHIPMPRCFEWNVLHHPQHTQATCFDMDGVLTLFKPTTPVGWVVTGREESGREITERQLRLRGVQYKELFMKPGPQIMCADWKAECYKRLPARLFVESDYGQAQVIARKSGKPVLHFEKMEVIR